MDALDQANQRAQLFTQRHGHQISPLALMPSTAFRQTYEAKCSRCGEHLLWYPEAPAHLYGRVATADCSGK